MPKGKPHFGELISYWQSLPKKDDGLIPCKTAFSPMQVIKMLPSLFFIERLDKYHMHVRLMGDALELAVRSILPNRNVYETIPQPDWDAVETYFDTLGQQPCAGHALRSLSLGNGLIYDLESVALPLANDKCEPDFFIGLADFKQNHEKSVLVQRGRLDVTGYAILEYWDVGYGVPAAGEKEASKAS